MVPLLPSSAERPCRVNPRRRRFWCEPVTNGAGGLEISDAVAASHQMRRRVRRLGRGRYDGEGAASGTRLRAAGARRPCCFAASARRFTLRRHRSCERPVVGDSHREVDRTRYPARRKLRSRVGPVLAASPSDPSGPAFGALAELDGPSDSTMRVHSRSPLARWPGFRLGVVPRGQWAVGGLGPAANDTAGGQPTIIDGGAVPYRAPNSRDDTTH